MPVHRRAWAGAAALSLSLHLVWGLAPRAATAPDRTAAASSTGTPGAVAPPAIVVQVRASPQPVMQTPATAVARPHPQIMGAMAVPEGSLVSSATSRTAARDDHGDTTYLPRSALTSAPRVLAPVLLTTPPSVPDGQYQADLTLYIDEQGHVRRVRVDSAGLLPELEDQARQAFLASHFTPGEVRGQPVRSRLRVAVEFEALGPARTTGIPTP